MGSQCATFAEKIGQRHKYFETSLWTYNTTELVLDLVRNVLDELVDVDEHRVGLAARANVEGGLGVGLLGGHLELLLGRRQDDARVAGAHEALEAVSCDLRFKKMDFCSRLFLVFVGDLKK